MKALFVKRESTIIFRSKPELVIPSMNSVLKSKNSLRYFGSIIWNALPIEIRDHSISSFVTKIKQWKSVACPCTIYKSYIGSDYKYLNHGLKIFNKRVKDFENLWDFCFVNF